MRALACFDFDGTLTRGDSLLPFLRAAVGSPRFVWALLCSLPWLVGYAVGRVQNDVAKTRLLTCTLGGRPLDAVRAQAQAFAGHGVPTLLRHEVMERLRWHQQQGHVCVLISASPSLYLEPWAAAQGFAACLATNLAVDEAQRLTGALEGNNCHGDEKLRRLHRWQAELGEPSELTYAYGDTSGDLPLLRLARYGHWLGSGGSLGEPEHPAPWPARHSVS